MPEGAKPVTASRPQGLSIDFRAASSALLVKRMPAVAACATTATPAHARSSTPWIPGSGASGSLAGSGAREVGDGFAASGAGWGFGFGIGLAGSLAAFVSAAASADVLESRLRGLLEPGRLEGRLPKTPLGASWPFGAVSVGSSSMPRRESTRDRRRNLPLATIVAGLISHLESPDTGDEAQMGIRIW